MTQRVLITGGAGFIGSHVADELLQAGHRVRALDDLDPQVHGAERRRPSYLDPRVELLVGDIRDRAAVDRALEGVDAVVHLAARVGVGQSMYQIEAYTSVNDAGTAVLLEGSVDRKIQKLVVGSSMSVYGEGIYVDARGEVREDVVRTRERLGAHEWDPVDEGGQRLSPRATPETKRPDLSSVYALSKYVQERMSLLVGNAYGISTIALRIFNVYGPRQALSNPYTGVLAIFASRILAGRSPLIFEDGEQLRDFVHVRDVARAVRLAVEASASNEVLNVGSGRAYSVREVAEKLGATLGARVAPEVTSRYRVGDVRHCFADVERARRVLDYRPSIAIEDGVAELARWLVTQRKPSDRVDAARTELDRRGLTL